MLQYFSPADFGILGHHPQPITESVEVAHRVAKNA
jgi:hypothetical protein